MIGIIAPLILIDIGIYFFLGFLLGRVYQVDKPKGGTYGQE